MTPCVPHLDLVFLHFQSVKPWRSLIMKSLSPFQRTASQLIWLRYVCQNGGTVSKAYIFYECSLIWLNNLTIHPLKVSSLSQLMWLSLCLNKITQMHYATFVMLWFFFFSSSGVCPIFLSVFHLLLREKSEVPSFSGKPDKHVDKADRALCDVWNQKSPSVFLKRWGWTGKSISQNQR